MPGSGVNGAFLDSNSQTGLIHIPPQVFSVRSGAPAGHTTAAFLQANLDGSTTVQPTSVLIGQEPTLTDELVRIVEFRVQAGLTNSATGLTSDLVAGLVQDGFVSPQQANQLIANVLQQLPADAPITLTLQTPSPVEGAPLSSVVVASLHDADPAGRATDFTATISWGDGSTSTATAADGTILQNTDGSFSIYGTHTYNEEALGLTYSVAVDDRGGASDSKSSTISVADAPLSVLAAPNLALAFQNIATGTVSVATFSDANPNASASDFASTTILWADGTSSVGTVQLITRTAASATFQVLGSHTYTSGGTFQPSVQIIDTGGSSAVAGNTVNVASDISAEVRAWNTPPNQKKLDQDIHIKDVSHEDLKGPFQVILTGLDPNIQLAGCSDPDQ